MNRLYQWLHERAISFRATTFEDEPTRTRRTEVTVREHERTLLVSASTASQGAACPLCGQPVSPNTHTHALHPLPSLAKSSGPLPGPAIASETTAPAQQGPANLKVLPRRLR